MFQRALDIILSLVKWKFIVAYLNNISICPNGSDVQINEMRFGLNFLKNTEITLKLKNCELLLFTNCTYYLRKVIKSGWLDIRSQSIHLIRGLRTLCSITESRSFLGSSRVLCRLVPIIVCTAAHLNRKLRKDQPHTK